MPLYDKKARDIATEHEARLEAEAEALHEPAAAGGGGAMSSGSGTTLVRAAILSTSLFASGQFTAMALDATGQATGSALTVYGFADQGENDIRYYLPKLAVGYTVWVVQGNDGKYYLIQPTLIAKGSNDSTVNDEDMTVPDDIAGTVFSAGTDWT